LKDENKTVPSTVGKAQYSLSTQAVLGLPDLRR